MGVAVLHPHDCFNDIFSRNNPHRQKKTLPNRRRRSPPPPPPPASVSAFVPKGLLKNVNNNNKVRILKRGEDLTVEKPDLQLRRQIGPDPAKISTPIHIPGRKSMPAMFYAGPVTSTSPPPSDVPFPAFFAKKSVSDATIDLNRILGLSA